MIQPLLRSFALEEIPNQSSVGAQQIFISPTIPNSPSFEISNRPPPAPLPPGERGAGEQKGHRVKEINARGARLRPLARTRPTCAPRPLAHRVPRDLHSPLSPAR